MFDVLAVLAIIVALAVTYVVWRDKSARRVFEEWIKGESDALKKRLAALESKLDGGTLPPKQ